MKRDKRWKWALWIAGETIENIPWLSEEPHQIKTNEDTQEYAQDYYEPLPHFKPFSKVGCYLLGLPILPGREIIVFGEMPQQRPVTRWTDFFKKQ